jgi:uncharacterized protein (TIGR00725 family)
MNLTMNNRFIIGVMGPGENATPEQNELAFEMGSAIAKEGWITLTGGRAFGVMDAALHGATEEGGTTIGILPGTDDTGCSPHASIKIFTGLGAARNSINVLTSHVIVVCGMSAGTATEVAMAIKADKRIILVNLDDETVQFFRKLGTYKIAEARGVSEAILLLKNFLSVYL